MPASPLGYGVYGFSFCLFDSLRAKMLVYLGVILWRSGAQLLLMPLLDSEFELLNWMCNKLKKFRVVNAASLWM